MILENIEIENSIIKGFVQSRRGTDNVGVTKVLNESLFDTQELSDQVLLTSERYRDGFFNRVILGSNLEINNTEVFGSVSLSGAQDYRPVVSNSSISNLIHYSNEGYSIRGQIPKLRIGSHHIESSNISKSETGLHQVNSFGQADQTNYIRNATLKNSSLVGSFKIDHLIADNSTIDGPLVARGHNRVEETAIWMSNSGRENGEVSHISNIRLLSSLFYDQELDGDGDTCNDIIGPVDLSSLNSTCSNIAQAMISGGDLYFSSLMSGVHYSIDLNLSVVRSWDGLQTSGLTATDYSLLDLTLLDFFSSSVSVKRTRVGGKFKLEDGHELEKVTLSGAGEGIKLSSRADLNHVRLTGEMTVEMGASLTHSIVRGNSSGSDAVVVMSNSSISESFVTDSTLGGSSKVQNGSIVRGSDLGPNSVVNASTVSNSELKSSTNISDASYIGSSTINSNVNVVYSEISGSQLSESVSDKRCESSDFNDPEATHCRDLSYDLEYPKIQNLEEVFMWEDDFLLGIAPAN